MLLCGLRSQQQNDESDGVWLHKHGLQSTNGFVTPVVLLCKFTRSAYFVVLLLYRHNTALFVGLSCVQRGQMRCLCAYSHGLVVLMQLLCIRVCVCVVCVLCMCV